MPPPTFDNSYARLPATFYATAIPAKVADPSLLHINEPLAVALGLDPQWLRSDAGLDMLCGRALPDGATPIAMAYAGHQFGGWSPQLGDGRAILLGEVIANNGARYDIQLKGAGRTRWSRGGDGKAGLGPVMREYIISEAMAALGVPTTRALAAVTTGEHILRDPPEPGAILTRAAQSHVRIGTFQYFYARQDERAIQQLSDYIIKRHYPDIDENHPTDHKSRYRDMFRHIMLRQAHLIAQWMTLGFIHGVMNTDNTQIAGETLDYGPCAFLDNYHPNKVFSSIDHNGRYAWGNQPAMAQWNLTRLAEAILHLLDPDQGAAIAWVEQTLDTFRDTFVQSLNSGFRAKLGLLSNTPEHADFVSTTLAALAHNEVDFTLFFRHLTRVASGAAPDQLRALFHHPNACDSWLSAWRQQRAQDQAPTDEQIATMQRHNPIFIPRNHRVEQAIQAGYRGDDAPFLRLLKVLAHPFDEQPEHADLEAAPQPEEVVTRTFCGT